MQTSLYDRLGGKDSIAAVVEDFVAACADDSRINAKFAKSDIARLKTMLVDQVCEATAGPCTYMGRDMKETHTGMGVTTGEFDALVDDLVSTLDRFSVPPAEREELLGLLAPMKLDIVDRYTGDRGIASGQLPARPSARHFLRRRGPAEGSERSAAHNGVGGGI